MASKTAWAITATMFGNSVDLTPYVAEATWKHGSKPPNYFGHLADPAIGTLTLLNHGGSSGPSSLTLSWIPHRAHRSRSNTTPRGSSLARLA